MKPGRYITRTEFRRVREEELDLSQDEAGEILGFDGRTIQRWESGETKKVRRAMLDKLRDEVAKRKRGAPRAK